MSASYWTGRTLSRRSALRAAAAAGGGVASLSLIGCGGGSSKGTTTTSDSRAISTLDSAKGIAGGTLKLHNSGGPITVGTTIIETDTAGIYGGLSYESLLSHKWGQESIAANDFLSLEPQLAVALPEQPDQLTFVYKLRPGVKFHNGRTLVAEDVAYSFDRYTNHLRSNFRSRFQTFLDKVETPDPQTAVIKMKFPYADGLITMAGHTGAYIMAREFEESDAALQRRMGTGPFINTDVQPPVSNTFKRNPDYYMKPYPYFDEVLVYGVLDAAKRVADFVAGQVHMPWWMSADERDQVKSQRPNARLQEDLLRGQAVFMRTDKAPFNDKRVRQALSMAIDRKKVRDGATKGEGRPDQWFNVMYKDTFGSREVSELGPAAKYWDFNPAEAKKLMSAAGIDKPIESQMGHWDSTVVGQWMPDIATLVQAQWREQGLANVKDIPQAAQIWNQTGNIGNYDGMGLLINTGLNNGAPSFALTIKDRWYWGPNGEHSTLNLSYSNNKELSDLGQKQLSLPKLEDRKAVFRQMEPLIAEEQSMIVLSTTTQSWFFDPILKNARMASEIGSRHYTMKWWMDKA